MPLKFDDITENPPQTAYLAGAGISSPIPSALPTAAGFLTKIIEKIAENETQKDALLQKLFGYQKARKFTGDFLRFESVMSSIKLCIDQNLDVLNIFTKCESPNFYHFFLARQLEKGSIILATNFDILIEIACRVLHIEYQVVVTDEDFGCFVEKPEQYPRPIIKLHGGHNLLLSDGSRKPGIFNIKATLEQIGRQYPNVQNTNLCSLLKFIFQKRHICILGYSGCDDFDIMPILKSQKIEKGMMWIEHVKQNEIYSIDETSADLDDGGNHSAFMLPSRELLNCKKDSGEDITIVVGDTAKILKILDAEDKKEKFPYHWEKEFAEWKNKFLEKKENRQLLLAEIIMKIGRYREAVSILENIPNEQLDAFQKNISLCSLACSYLYADEQEKAINKLAMLAVSETSGQDLHVKGFAYLNLARINTDMGNIPQAEMYLDAAASIFKKENDIVRLGDCYHESGRIYIKEGNILKAVELLKISVKISEAIGDLDGAAMSQGELGRAYTENKDYELAKEYVNKAVSSFSLTGNKIGMGIGCHALGNIHYYKENFESADYFYKKAIELDKQTNQKLHLGHSLHCLGNSLLAQGKIEEAKRNFLESLSIKRTIGDEAGIQNTQQMLEMIKLMEQNLPNAGSSEI
ncbi:MAG: tetratricopeptide repeat protein [Candidatus Omnitrophota bacterium]